MKSKGCMRRPYLPVSRDERHSRHAEPLRRGSARAAGGVRTDAFRGAEIGYNQLLAVHRGGEMSKMAQTKDDYVEHESHKHPIIEK